MIVDPEGRHHEQFSNDDAAMGEQPSDTGLNGETALLTRVGHLVIL